MSDKYLKVQLDEERAAFHAEQVAGQEARASKRDLIDALTALVAHYRRHTDHRCDILENAQQVLAGHPLPRFEYPDDEDQKHAE